jgi:hypothetical protein
VGFSSARFVDGGDLIRQRDCEASQEVCSVDGGVPDCSLLSMFRNAPGCHFSILSRKNIQMKKTVYRG